MTNYARIINGVAVDVSLAPANSFHKTLSDSFIQVPDEVEAGWVLDNNTWSPPTPVSTPTTGNLQPTPPQFMLLLTLMERGNLRRARDVDVVVQDLMLMLEDPRLAIVDLTDHSVIEVLNYMTTTTPQLLTTARVARILTGQGAQA